MKKFWFLFAGVAVFLALITLLTAFAGGSGPRGYAADRYERANHLDLRGDEDNRAYTSPKPPTTVAREITAKFRPLAQHADGSGMYLRYSEDAVVIQPRGSGSVIHLLDVDDAYRRYHTFIGGSWGYTGAGGSFRGGGPGSGK